jgi:tetratricopeptide (TPR) repeat protein
MKFKLVFIVVSLSILSGCGIWRNFTTYFNRYYNTSLQFDNAMDELAKQKKDLFAFKEEPVPQAAKQSLDKVVEKASKILQFDSKSAFFDDALLLIGKSFYYLQEYSKAYRKFQELSTLKDSDLLLENKLWIGKTQLQLRLFEEGLSTLEEVKKEAFEEGEREIYTDATLKQISYYKYKEEYDKAIEMAKALLDVSKSDELKAEVTNEIGKLYVSLKEYKEAADFFEKVAEFEPTFEIEFNSKLELAKLNKLLDKKDKSLQILLELKDQNRYRPYLDQINLEIGLIKYEQNDINEAMAIFTEVDTTFKQSISGNIAAYMKAEIFMNYYKLYDSAKIFFDKVAGTQTNNEYKEKSKKKSEILKKLLTFREMVNKYRKQLFYIENPEAYSQDSLDFVIWRNRDSSVIKAEQEEAKRNKTTVKTLTQPVKSTISADSLKKIMTKFEYDYANVFFGELSEPDSAYKYYINIIENYPKTQYTPKTYFALGAYYELKNKKEIADSLYKLVYDNYPNDPIVNIIANKLGLSQVELSSDPIEKNYREAEKLYQQKDYKSAINKLKKIYKENDKSLFAAKSLYTIGFIYENDLKFNDSAAVYYDTLNIKYKNTEYARNVSQKLNLYKLEEKSKQAVRDSIAKAKEDSIKAVILQNEKKKEEKRILDSLNQANPDELNIESEEPDSSNIKSPLSYLLSNDFIFEQEIALFIKSRQVYKVFYGHT